MLEHHFFRDAHTSEAPLFKLEHANAQAWHYFLTNINHQKLRWIYSQRMFMLPATKASHIFPAAGGGGSLFVCSRSPGPQQAPPTSQILAEQRLKRSSPICRPLPFYPKSSFPMLWIIARSCSVLKAEYMKRGCSQLCVCVCAYICVCVCVTPLPASLFRSLPPPPSPALGLHHPPPLALPLSLSLLTLFPFSGNKRGFASKMGSVGTHRYTSSSIIQRHKTERRPFVISKQFSFTALSRRDCS